MKLDLASILEKVIEKAKSSRIWAVAGGNVVALSEIHNEWARAAVVIAVNLGYILSETIIKLVEKPKAV